MAWVLDAPGFRGLQSIGLKASHLNDEMMFKPDERVLLLGGGRRGWGVNIVSLSVRNVCGRCDLE